MRIKIFISWLAIVLASCALLQAADEEKSGRVFFSPNGDGIMDNAVFRLSVSNPGNVASWEFIITDNQAHEVKRLSGVKATPSVLDWNGRDEHNQLIPDGTYHYALNVVTFAGNSVKMTPQELICDRQAPTAKVSVEPAIFSGEEGSAKPTAHFYLEGSDPNGIHSWLMKIKNVQSGLSAKSFYGKGQPQAKEDWDGRADSGDPAPDGEYEFTLAAEDSVGNKSVTLDQIARLDTTPPELTLSVDPPIFAPKSESAKNRALFGLTAQDASNIAEWSLRFANSKGAEVYRMKGEGKAPGEIAWEGANEKNAVFPDDTYKVQLFARDEVGNEGKSPQAVVTIDNSRPILAVAPEEELVPSLMPEIHPEESGRGIVIHLAAEVLFETGKSDLRTVAYPTLDEAAGLIKKYPRRTVLVEGHTDNVPIHSQQFPSNQELSEARAQSIMKYFIDARKIDSSRLTAKGCADTRPIAANSTPEGRQKNRRVEIVILKAAAPEKTALDPNDKSPKEGGIQP